MAVAEEVADTAAVEEVVAVTTVAEEVAADMEVREGVEMAAEAEEAVLQFFMIVDWYNMHQAEAVAVDTLTAVEAVAVPLVAQVHPAVAAVGA